MFLTGALTKHAEFSRLSGALQRSDKCWCSTDWRSRSEFWATTSVCDKYTFFNSCFLLSGLVRLHHWNELKVLWIHIDCSCSRSWRNEAKLKPARWPLTFLGLKMSYRLLGPVSSGTDVVQSIMSDVSVVHRLPGHTQAEGGFFVNPHVPHPVTRRWRVRGSHNHTAGQTSTNCHIFHQVGFFNIQS